MEIQGKRVAIRPLAAQDAPAYLALAQDPKVAQPAGIRRLSTLKAAEQHIASAQGTEFAITQGNRLIGEVGVYPRTADPADPAASTREIGYALAADHWGRGLMTEALQLVLAELFRTGITAVWAGVYPTNRRSIAVLARLGFEYRFTAPLPAGLTGGKQQAEAYFERVNESLL
ncbi:GNAT family N-acetyltransferase [Lacticaseibacillus jixianensis]|uniref:GNAT family N-acetyltransferase n=1 Tax=Lacticaseibacillus jixianensis TaxID=2486012 RepID=A0ABW4B889_9LACO|nr:GNAT family N-acetyltransferase [Lacticaseibacillus jixianensis]